ncbi:hypothetical protein ACFFXG_004441, partial [Salmonella enterica]
MIKKFNIAFLTALIISTPVLATTVGSGTEKSINIGNGALVTNMPGGSDAANGVAIGNNADARAGNNIAIGNSATAHNNYDSVAIGNGASATGAFSSIAIGRAASSTSPSGGIAVGDSSNASGNYALAIGNGASAAGDNSTAIGGGFSTIPGASASSGGTAIGANSVADKGIAIGSGSRATRADQVDIGSRQITGLKDGTRVTDAATVGQMNAADTATLKNAQAYTDTAKADAIMQANQHSDANLATAKG